MNYTAILKQNAPGPSTSQNLMLKRIQSLVKPATAILGGSLARNTHLKTFDCDIFIIFPQKTQNISDVLGKKIKKLSPERVHGSRDYYHIHQDEILYEIIPVLKTTNPEDAVNVTDVSPLHIIWVKNNVKKLEDDVRLTKLFLQANQIYGAESYINGFSGYVTEIITIHYKGFNNLIKAVAQWKTREVLDPAKHYKSKQDALFSINKSKQGPLLVIDPVQKSRNAAAAVSEEQYKKFIRVAKKFIKSPTEKSFTLPPLEIKKLKKKKGTLVILELQPLKGKRDVSGAKLIKVWQHITKQLQNNDFSVEETDWRWDKTAIIYFRISPEKHEKTKKQYGPSKDAPKNHIQAFKKKHKTYKKEGDRYYTIIKRGHTEPESLIQLLFTDPYITERVKSIKWHPMQTK